MTSLTKQQRVIAQYEAIRRSGQTNMLDKIMVQHIANKNNFYALVVAIENDYSKILKTYGEVIKTIEENDIPETLKLRDEND